jgi:hypothetical protein
MPFRKLLLSIPSDRQVLVFRIFNEIYNDSVSTTHYNNHVGSITELRQKQKESFLSLIDENNKLLQDEKEYCKERFIYDYEIENATYKCCEPKKCNTCKLTRYSEKFCENCISLHLQKFFNSWTSGNDVIDDFIKKCQEISSIPNQIMEWIPFDQFENVEYLTRGGFGSIYTAIWKRGRVFDYDENKKELIYFGSQGVVLKLLYNSNDPGKRFFDEVVNNFI